MTINQMTKDRREAYVEVLEILKHMEKKYISKIPIDLREFFERNASKEYKFHINPQMPLENQKLKENTINILAMLNINYWCETEEHKQELLRKYYKNDIKYEQELRKTCNTDNLFKRETRNVEKLTEKEINSLPENYEEKRWYKRLCEGIFKFIKKIFD